jgi:hypothetical protein
MSFTILKKRYLKMLLHTTVRMFISYMLFRQCTVHTLYAYCRMCSYIVDFAHNFLPRCAEVVKIVC